MLNIKVYGNILKTQLFRLGGFVIKKKFNNLLAYKKYKIFLFKDLFYDYLFVDPIYSLSQLLSAFKFYIDLIVYKKKLIICSLIGAKFFLFSSYALKTKNIYLFENLGGVFTNYFGSLFSQLSHNSDIALKIPSIGIIFNSKNNFSVFKEFSNLGIPTLGLVCPSAVMVNSIHLNHVTYPLYFQYNIYILYFFIRLFLKILFIYKFKLCLE